MNTHAFEKKLHSLKARFGLQLFVLAAVVCTSWIVTDHANAVYILTGPEDAAIVLNEEEVREGEMSSQLVYLSSGQSGYDMSLTAGQEVTVTHDGSTVTAKARSETVAELLERLHITPSPLEMVAVDLDEDSAELTIASELTYYDQVEEPATYETVRVANPSLPKGTEKVVQEGADGVRTSIYEVVWSGGEEISRQSAVDAANVLTRAQSAADLLRRRTLLLKKQELIGDVIDSAYRSLFELSDERYFDVLLGMANKYAEKQAGEIAFNERDLGRLPADFEMRLQSALAESGASLRVSREPRAIDGGFVLIYGGVEENCSFEALFEEQREALQDEVYALLFA